MEKFSFYEILSFLLPGFILIAIVQLYQHYVFGFKSLLKMDGDFGENVILLCLSLFAGIVIHVFTFWLFKCKWKYFKWFENIIKPSVQKTSVSNKFIQRTVPFLNEDYRKLKKHSEKPVNENEADNNLFDFAYYYLEVNDKISAAKNYHSLYFWFRNMFTISTFLIPVSLIILAITLIGTFSKYQIETAICITVINIVLFLTIIPTAHWLRERYIGKVFWSYYVERIHINENKSNN